MRHIAALPDAKAPRDGEFKFRERADVLVKKWHQFFSQPTLDEDGEQGHASPRCAGAFADPPFPRLRAVDRFAIDLGVCGFV